MRNSREAAFAPSPIAAVPPVRAERAIGWAAHYAIGVGFASLLPAIWGWEWIRHPTFGPAMIVGIGTVAAPFFIMQPGMGAGIAASRTPNPAAARLQSLATHAVFGLGLYLAATVVSSNGMRVLWMSISGPSSYTFV